MSDIDTPSGDATHSPCPSDLDLAQFVEGRLFADARVRVLAHLDVCDDCRDIVATVVAATPAAAAGSGSSTEAPVWRRPRTWAAVAAVAATAMVALRLGSPPAPARMTAQRPQDAWADLAAAVGAERTVEARLSGLPSHVPLASPTRAASPEVSFALRALASRLSEDAQVITSDAVARRSARHVAGAAALAAGRAADGVALLDLALSDVPVASPARAAILVDLSAGHAELGETTARDHWRLALGAAEDALAADPESAAARFNRALALERLARTGDALVAWRALADDDRLASGWRDEAAGHVRALIP